MKTVKTLKKMGISTLIISSLFLNQSLYAGISTTFANDFNKIVSDPLFLANPGDSVAWANGKVMRGEGKTLIYTSGSYSMTLKSAADLTILANENADVKNQLIKDYGIDATAGTTALANNLANYTDARRTNAEPGSKALISPSGFPTYYIKYDPTGKASAVIGPDGKEMSFFSFEGTKDFSAMTGRNEQVVGDATSTTAKYGASDVPTTMDMAAREKKMAELTMSVANIIWGVAEVQKKECKQFPNPTKTMPKWIEAVVGNGLDPKDAKYKKGYYHEEIRRDEINRARDKLVNDRMAVVIEELKTPNPSSDLQIESYDLQIQSLNTYIDSYSGSKTFNMDKLGDEVTKLARIPTREALYAAAADAIANNNEDNLNNVEKWNKLAVDGVKQSRAAAAAGCARTKTVCGIDSCNQVPDPVSGSCEMSNLITILENGPMYDYASLYVLPQVPSIELGERMTRLENTIENMVASFPTSSAGYDWTSPLVNPLAPLWESRRTSAMACPTNIKSSEYDTTMINTKGQAGDDPLIDIAKYTLGRNITPAEYAAGKKFYDDQIASGKSEEQAKGELTNYVLTLPGGKSYLDTLNGTNNDLLLETAGETYCTPATCNSFAGTKKSEFELGSLNAEKLSENAKTFLRAYGIIKEDEVAATSELFNTNWNYTDLVLGEPGQRNAYFLQVQGILKEALAYDIDAHNRLVIERNQLIRTRDEYKATILPNSSIKINSLAKIELPTSTIDENGKNNLTNSANGSNSNAENNSVSNGSGSGSKNSISSDLSNSSLTGTANLSSVGGTPNINSLYNQSLAGKSGLGGLSSGTNAILKKTSDRNKITLDKLKRYSSNSGKGGSFGMLVSSDNSKKASVLYSAALKNSMNNFLKNPIASKVSGELINGLAANNKEDNGSNTFNNDSSAPLLFGYGSRSTYGSRSGGSRSPASLGSSSVANSYDPNKNDSDSFKSTQNTFFGGRKPEDLELFKNISKAYQRVTPQLTDE